MKASYDMQPKKELLHDGNVSVCGTIVVSMEVINRISKNLPVHEWWVGKKSV